MSAAYSFVLTLVLVLAAPWWSWRMAREGKYREGLKERLGRVPERLRAAVAGKRVLWLHAVSVGEVLAAGRLIEELRAQDGSWAVIVSTTTRTGQQLARERFGAANVFYFPLDFAFAVRPYLEALRPRVMVLVETEFWPRLLVECYRRGVKVAVVNGRISDRSWPRYQALRVLWKRLLGPLKLVLAQSALDAERLSSLGAGNVQVGGNLKYDVRAPLLTPLTAALREKVAAKIVIAGSTLAGEEELLLAVAPKDAVLVLAPRHPERFERVAELLSKSGRDFVRRSEWASAPRTLAAGTVFLLDSIGELASLYSLAWVAFVGGSLVAAGGHNPLEAAQFSVPVLMGPNYENFRSIVDRLRQAEGIGIVTAAELGAAVRSLLDDEAAAVQMGARALAVFERESGATARAVRALGLLMEGAP